MHYTFKWCDIFSWPLLIEREQIIQRLDGIHRESFFQKFHTIVSTEKFLKSQNNEKHRMILAHIISRGLVYLWTRIYIQIYIKS